MNLYRENFSGKPCAVKIWYNPDTETYFDAPGGNKFFGKDSFTKIELYDKFSAATYATTEKEILDRIEKRELLLKKSRQRIKEAEELHRRAGFNSITSPSGEGKGEG